MIFAAKSHTGRIRKNNEDYFYIPVQSKSRENSSTPLLQNVMIIADGMGGHAAGEVASAAAVAGLVHYFSENWATGKLENADGMIRSAVNHANSDIFLMSQQTVSLRGMGTTLTAALIYEDEALIGHVGDSRAYLYSGGTINQLTKDHTYVAHLVESKEITPEEAIVHPKRNVIMRAVGTHSETEPDLIKCSWKPGDILLLCTDGLTEYIRDNDIFLILQKQTSLEKKVKELVRLALRRGGADNITVAAALNDAKAGAPV
jgi:PPM family protein phosphatase